MADANFVQIAPLLREPGVMEIKTPQKLAPSTNGAMIWYVLRSSDGQIRARNSYGREPFPPKR